MLMNEYGERETDGSSTTRRLTALRPFPIVLFEVLSRAENDLEYQAILRWEPMDGNAFVIFDRQRFATEIMPNHFPYQTQYPSFRRQLNIYGFTRISERGSECAIFSHPDFRRGCPDLCRTIRRTVHPRRKSTSKKQGFVVGIESTSFKRSNSAFMFGATRTSGEHSPSPRQQFSEQSIGGLGDDCKDHTHEGANKMNGENSRINDQQEAVQRSVRQRICWSTERCNDVDSRNTTIQVLSKPSNVAFAALSLPRGETLDPEQSSTWFHNLSNDTSSMVKAKEFNSSSSLQNHDARVLTQVLSKQTSDFYGFEKHAHNIQETWPMIQTSYDVPPYARERRQHMANTTTTKKSVEESQSSSSPRNQTLRFCNTEATQHVLPPYHDHVALSIGGEQQERSMIVGNEVANSSVAAVDPSRRLSHHLQSPIQLRMQDELTRMTYADSTSLSDGKKRIHPNTYIASWLRDVSSLHQHHQRLLEARNAAPATHDSGGYSNSAMNHKVPYSDEESSEMVQFLEDVDLDDDELAGYG